VTDTVLDLLPWLALGVLAAFASLAWLGNRICRRAPAELAEDAGLFETLRATPFVVAVFLDLNDLVLDFFGAPIAWVIASRLGLGRLKQVAVIEALIPGTQLLPTFTVLWLAARLLPVRALRPARLTR
jgi:hypothetical protein